MSASAESRIVPSESFGLRLQSWNASFCDLMLDSPRRQSTLSNSRIRRQQWLLDPDLSSVDTAPRGTIHADGSLIARRPIVRAPPPTLSMSTTSSSLVVLSVSGISWKPGPLHGKKPNLYVALYRNGKELQRTRTVERNLEPKWEHIFKACGTDEPAKAELILVTAE
ncbi:hypothetical protein FB45DRAFT_1097407 [Roridomyces roridus]|uniref:C2 domain-containing protein n=1 Tax=Roridomyces roridus TaxID=1738132 RepID=A0AAD7FGI9_9AGAR|nr:hypothetical protein FB45DRAFT_1097407 [Roridomyces roridus]